MIGACRFSQCRRARRGRRGFIASITAVTLIALVTVALTTIVAASVADARRTRRLAVDAQLRQLLQAGATDAAARAESWGDVPAAGSWRLEIPDSLAQRGFRVQLSIPPTAANQATAVEVMVEANSPAAGQAQSLRFSRSAGEWKLEDVGR
jgi:hypothetical protein